MNKTKQMWLCLEDGKVTKLISVTAILKEQKDITIRDLKDAYKEYKMRLLIA